MFQRSSVLGVFYCRIGLSDSNHQSKRSQSYPIRYQYAQRRSARRYVQCESKDDSVVKQKSWWSNVIPAGRWNKDVKDIEENIKDTEDERPKKPDLSQNLSQDILCQVVCQVWYQEKFLGTSFVYKHKYLLTAAHLFEELEDQQVQGLLVKEVVSESRSNEMKSDVDTKDNIHNHLDLHFRLHNGRAISVQARIKGIAWDADVAVLESDGMPAIIDAATAGLKNKCFRHSISDCSSKSIQMGSPVFCLGCPNHTSESVLVQGTCVQPTQTFPKLATPGRQGNNKQQHQSNGQQQRVQNSSSGTRSYNRVSSSVSRDYNQNNQGPTNSFLQLSIITMGGMSGSPVFDESGHLCGLLVKKFLDFGLALSVNIVTHVADALIESGKWHPRRLGMTVEEVMLSNTNMIENDVVEKIQTVVKGETVLWKQRYLRVSGIVPGGAAEKAGLRKGDIIATINDCALRSTAHLIDSVWSGKFPMKLKTTDGSEAVIE